MRRKKRQKKKNLPLQVRSGMRQMLPLLPCFLSLGGPSLAPFIGFRRPRSQP